MFRKWSAQGPKAAMLLMGCALVLVSMLAQFSVWPVHSIQRRAIRHEMKDRILAGLPESALTVFRFTLAEYEQVDFVDGGRELRSEGVMYDIVRTYTDLGGLIVIETARDDEETGLMAELGRLVQRRVDADEQGREQRQSVIGSWAPFFGAMPSPRIPAPPVSERSFGSSEPCTGRSAAAIDPGPPRRS